MKKETQTQIMKPIKVLSLVLLALLLLVPAASAETYTIIDEDLKFGDDTPSYSVGDSNVFLKYSNLITSLKDAYGNAVDPLFSSELVSFKNTAYSSAGRVYGNGISTRSIMYYSDGEADSTSTKDITGYLYNYHKALSGGYSSVSIDSFIYYNGSELTGYTSTDYLPLESGLLGCSMYFKYASFTYGATSQTTANVISQYNRGLTFAKSLASYISSQEGCYVFLYPNNYYDSSSVSAVDFNFICYGLSESSSSSSTQHVTVTYDDQSENYQVYVDTSDESVDVWVRGYVFGWLPVWTFGSNAFPPSTHFEWLTCPVRFLFWDVDWEVEVECNGESKFIYWNLDTPPIDGGTIPEPDPPFPDPDPELPDDPDPFDPTTPFPTPSYNPSGLPNKIPTSLKEIIGFNLTEIKDRFKESTPFYSNAFDFVASAIEALFDFLFGLIGVTLGVLIGFLSEPLTEIYNFIVWTSSVVFSFMDFLIIPNHIMSFLVDFVPVEIVNLALAALGLDILLNVLSIAIPDLITAYKSTVRTYYHKVDHGIQKGGKK